MANAIKTVMTYALNSSVKDFNIPFEYLARKFIVVTLIGKDRKVLVLNQDYKFSTKTTISTTKAWGPADGYTSIEVRRFTSATDRLVDFADGSILRAYDLNISQVQTLHVAEEARDLTADTIGVNNDGNLDARGRRIVNLANAVERGDAISYGQVLDMSNGAYQSYQNALAQAQEATRQQVEATRQAGIAATQAGASASSAGAAKTSETNASGSASAAAAARDLAQKWASNARNNPVVNGLFSAYHWALNAADSAATALGYRDTTKTYMDNAANSAASSKTEADRAKTEADKLQNNNAFAGAIKSVNTTTNDVEMKAGFTSQNLTAVNVKATSNIDSDGQVNAGVSMGIRNGGVFRWLSSGNSQEINVGNTGTGLYFNYTITNASFNLNGMSLDNARLIGSYGNIFARVQTDPALSNGQYYNTPEIRSGFRIRGNQSGADYAYVSFYGQEHVGSSWSAVVNVIGFSTNYAWYFNNDGSFGSPVDIRAGRNLQAAGEVLTGNGSGKLAASGDVYGNQWGGWLSAWLLGSAMSDLGRGGQQYRGSSRVAWEAPPGCFVSGLNTNVGDGRDLGIYYRQIIGRKIGGATFGIGDF